MTLPDKNPAIFLDRDGVIIVEKEFQCDPNSIEFVPGSLEGLSSVDNKFLLVIVSNQSGISRGYFAENEVIKFNQALDKMLKKAGIEIAGWYFCPHGPNDNCDCRKPKPGMFFKASEELNIDLKQSWMIGDKTSDISAGMAIGAKTILVKTGYAGQEKGALVIEPDFMASNLCEGINIIKSIDSLYKS